MGTVVDKKYLIITIDGVPKGFRGRRLRHNKNIGAVYMQFLNIEIVLWYR